jgi:CspA family cold shock protein
MSEENGLAKGRVKWFSAEKGYGFITRDGDDKDVFIHATEVAQGVELEPDDVVEFTIEVGKKGLMARALKLLPAS